MESHLTDFGLDRFLVLSHSSSVPVEQFTSKFKIFVYFLPNLKENSEYFLYILPRDLSENREIRMMMDKFGSRDSGVFLTMAATSKQFPSISMIRNFYNIKSSVMVAGFLDEGRHVLLWAYNHCAQEEVSDVLERTFATEPYFDLLYLGQDSFEDLLSSKIKSNRNLYRVKVRAMNPHYKGKETEIHIIPKMTTTREKVTALCRLNTRLEDQGIIPSNAVSIDEGLYETEIDLPVMSRLSNSLIRTPVYVSKFDATVKNDSVDICFNVTHLGKPALLRVISNLAKEMPDSGIRLTEVREI